VLWAVVVAPARPVGLGLSSADGGRRFVGAAKKTQLFLAVVVASVTDDPVDLLFRGERGAGKARAMSTRGAATRSPHAVSNRRALCRPREDLRRCAIKAAAVDEYRAPPLRTAAPAYPSPARLRGRRSRLRCTPMAAVDTAAGAASPEHRVEGPDPAGCVSASAAVPAEEAPMRPSFS